MKSSEARRELRQRRAELRARLTAARQEAMGQVGALAPVRRARQRRRLRRAAALVILAVLLSLIRCECGEAAPEEVARLPSPADAGQKIVPLVVRPPARLTGRVDPQPRASFAGKSAEATSWLDDFRLQVAARGPRLAQCFTGSERPGAVRWSAALNPSSGVVSDHELEMVGGAADVKSTQRRCLEGVLSAPPYALVKTGDEALARRVSLVIEF